MAKKDTDPKLKPDKKTTPSQKERFIEAARKAEADETGETFDTVIGRLIKPNLAKRQR